MLTQSDTREPKHRMRVCVYLLLGFNLKEKKYIRKFYYSEKHKNARGKFIFHLDLFLC